MKIRMSSAAICCLRELVYERSFRLLIAFDLLWALCIGFIGWKFLDVIILILGLDDHLSYPFFFGLGSLRFLFDLFFNLLHSIVRFLKFLLLVFIWLRLKNFFIFLYHSLFLSFLFYLYIHFSLLLLFVYLDFWLLFLLPGLFFFMDGWARLLMMLFVMNFWLHFFFMNFLIFLLNNGDGLILRLNCFFIDCICFFCIWIDVRFVVYYPVPFFFGGGL